MTLKLLTAPTTEPVSLADAKLHLREDHGDFDQQIASALTAARQWCEVFTRRSFITTSWRQTFKCLPRNGVLCLSRPPLISVSSFQYTDEDGTLQTVDSSLYEVDSEGDPGRIVRLYNQQWPTVRTSGEATPVQVTFSAGYGDASDVPEGIKQAILLKLQSFAPMLDLSDREMKACDTAAKALLATYCWGSYP